MITQKKSDLVDDLFKSGVGFDAMPLDDVVIPYAEADVKACAEIYLSQLDDLNQDQNKSLDNIVVLMNEMLKVLVEFETNGVKIDLETLDNIGTQFQEEHDQLSKRLEEIVELVMGDTIINLKSGADTSRLIYSREFKSPKPKAYHIQTFNIGTDEKGRPLRTPPMNDTEFNTDN